MEKRIKREEAISNLCTLIDKVIEHLKVSKRQIELNIQDLNAELKETNTESQLSSYMLDQHPRILKKKLIMVLQRMKVVEKLCN